MNISSRQSVSIWTRPFERITSSLESFSNCGKRTALQNKRLWLEWIIPGHNDYSGNDDDDENDGADVRGEGVVLYFCFHLKPRPRPIESWPRLRAPTAKVWLWWWLPRRWLTFLGWYWWWWCPARAGRLVERIKPRSSLVADNFWSVIECTKTHTISYHWHHLFITHTQSQE